MSGKLPIDRVREAEHAPKLLEQNKRGLAEEQARLREAAPAAPARPNDTAPGRTEDGRDG